MENLITLILIASIGGGVGFLFAKIGSRDSADPAPIKIFWIVFGVIATLFLLNGALGW